MPKEVWTFDGVEEWGDKSWMSTQATSAPKDNGMSALKAWTPYIIIAALLVISRISFFGGKGYSNK